MIADVCLASKGGAWDTVDDECLQQWCGNRLEVEEMIGGFAPHETITKDGRAEGAQA